MTKETIYVLLVDDDPDFVADFRLLLPDDLVFNSVETAADAYEYIQHNDVTVVFLDIDLGPGENGLELLQRLKTEYPYLSVIMITADDSTATIVKAIQKGASDYVGKSPNLEKLKIAIKQATRHSNLEQRVNFLESELDTKIGNLIGDSEPIRQVKLKIADVADVSSTVFITGKSGTGKELVARDIHRFSNRKNEPFVPVNCAALSQNLFESELFGHEKNAFTDAKARRIGKFELAGNGTIFLDEITEIPINLQSKLLRVLQEKEFERVGGNRMIKFHGRILASSNRDIEEAMANGDLREDLLYRLNVAHIELPLLEDRKSDIPILARYFLSKFATEMKKNISGLTDEALKLLCVYSWPGNVRELSNCIESAIVHANKLVLDDTDFGRVIISDGIPHTYEDAKKFYVKKFQREFISAKLANNDGNISKTAEDMEVSRQGLKKMMDECGLS